MQSQQSECTPRLCKILCIISKLRIDKGITHVKELKMGGKLLFPVQIYCAIPTKGVFEPSVVILSGWLRVQALNWQVLVYFRYTCMSAPC